MVVGQTREQPVELTGEVFETLPHEPHAKHAGAGCALVQNCFKIGAIEAVTVGPVGVGDAEIIRPPLQRRLAEERVRPASDAGVGQQVSQQRCAAAGQPGNEYQR